MPPIPRKPLILYVSAIARSFGALLAQHDENGTERAIYYISKTMVGHELNYSFIEKACLAVVFASQKFRHYMLPHKIKLIAKIDPLKYLLSKAMLIGRMAKWVMILSEYDIEYVEQKAIKGQVIIDQLAEAPIYLENPLISEFPNESIFNLNIANHWKLYFDGSYTQHGSGAGIFFITPQGDCIPRSYKLAFPCTNNIAEYEALTIGLRIAVQWNIMTLKVYGDSQLIINQVNNEYQTKDDKLTPYKRLVENLKESFVDITFEQVPRTNNRAADAMATIGSLLEIPQNVPKYDFLVEQLLVPAFKVPESEFVCEIVGPNDQWYQDIYTYLRIGIIPADLRSSLRRTFIKKASRFVILGETLYRRSIEGTLLRCLNPEEASTALTEVHNGICGSHSSGMTLSKKLLRSGYYWPTMDREAHEYVKKCLQCQQHGDLIHAPAQELHPIITPWPFSQWGLDLIGKITPTSSNGHKFIITATEYFTKWVEAIPMTYITGKQISKFILNYLICRYGVPQAIISDNGTPFKNQEVRDLCDKFKIQHRFSTPYYPQGNGQAEATNKTILKILKKTVNDAGRDWHLQLNPALWAYRTSIRTPTGATPFSLVYGSEAILPIEIELPSLRVSLQNLITDEEYRVSRLNELELLDERRLDALNHLQVYQNRLKRSYNKKIRSRTFQVGELVLKENQKNVPNPSSKGKFEPNWLGPFIVTASYKSGAYQLSTPEGEPLQEPMNSSHLKKFYA